MELPFANKSLLVTGGAGFIGSHFVKKASLAGYHVVTFDNLSTGLKENVKYGTLIQGDLADTHALNAIFGSHHFDAVVHFAASIDVAESSADPLKYYDNNVSNTINLLKSMRLHNVQNLIFSSTAAVYGQSKTNPISENHPCQPINPYGETKLIVEKLLADCDLAYGLKSICLRYFNAAGGDPEKELVTQKSKHSHLIPLLLKSLKSSFHPITVYGTDYPTPDGTCVRDYIHVEDLASAHLLALEKLLKGGPSATYNLGNGKGYSVKEVIAAAENVTGKKANVILGERRPGDPPALVADPSKARQELGWLPQYPLLEEIVRDAD